MKKNIRTILIVIFVILLLVFLYSSYRVTRTIHEYNESARYYDRTRKGAVAVDDSTGAPVAPGPETDSEQQRPVSPINVDFDALLSTNADVKGWLYSPDTKIDYPVVQSLDNSYYLYRLLDGSYNPSGTLFIDFRDMGDFSSKNTVIYGHHMGDGSMLASLVEYADQAYYDEHPVMYLNTPEGNYRLDIFAGFVTWYDSRVYSFDFESRTEFEEWLNLMRGYSDFSSDVKVGQDDRVVTLSTCTYDYDNARYVLMAKLVPLDSN